MDAIRVFTGQYRFLSNFYSAEVSYDGMKYRSVEHAYQAAKTTDRKQRRMIQMLPKPADAKRAGRRGNIRHGWDDILRITIMRFLVMEKFKNHPDLAALLEATGDAHLVEGNSWHDNFWGQCACTECDTHADAANWLGRILMEVRTDLRRQAQQTSVVSDRTPKEVESVEPNPS